MKSGERTVRMSIADEDSEYMAGHVVDGEENTSFLSANNSLLGDESSADNNETDSDKHSQAVDVLYKYVSFCKVLFVNG